jgi:hypothetical protein
MAGLPLTDTQQFALRALVGAEPGVTNRSPRSAGSRVSHWTTPT